MDNKNSQLKPGCSRNQSGCASLLSEKISQNSALFTLAGAEGWYSGFTPTSPFQVIPFPAASFLGKARPQPAAVPVPHRRASGHDTSSPPLLHSPRSTLLLLFQCVPLSSSKFKRVRTAPGCTASVAEPPLLVRGRGTSGSPARPP